MGQLRRRLEERGRAGEPVRVGLIGAGQMGLGLAAVLGRMPGMRLVAVADLVCWTGPWLPSNTGVLGGTRLSRLERPRTAALRWSGDSGSPRRQEN